MTVNGDDLVIQDGGETGLVGEELSKEERTIQIWLSRFTSEQTQRAYERDIRDWLEHLEARGRGLFSATLEDAVTYQRALGVVYSKSTQARKIAGVKSLYSLMKAIGITTVNVFAVVRKPTVSGELAKRILSEGEVFRLFAAASDHPRNLALLHVLYYGPLRAQETSDLRWGDLVERPDVSTGQLQVTGKGDRGRSCPLPGPIWDHLRSIKPVDTEDSDPVFLSQRKNALSTNQIRRLVREYSHKAGIDKPVSPHWLRHAHASHSTDRGCPMATICAQLGHKDPSTTYRYIHARPQDASSFYLPV